MGFDPIQYKRTTRQQWDDAADRPAVWSDIEEALARFEDGDGFVGPCELLVAPGTK